VFAFGTGESTSWLLSSGDLAPDRLDPKLDVGVPIKEPAQRARLQRTLEILLAVPGWELDADGNWHRGRPGADDALRQLAGTAARHRTGTA
jgi:polyphosphate kinase